MAGGLPVLLITANVGSIFEEPSVMLKIWTEEFLSTISRLDPKFIALHCQEVGGKNYEQSMKHVEYFVRLLMSSEELRLFDKVRVFLDEDYSSAEHFTALGNFYFVHESIKDVLLWDFKERIFVSANGKEVHSGNVEAVTTKEKAKFPQNFFPECKWSRKGFLRTRWNISGTVFDLINIHLFHDASNFIAMETFPSVYSKTRRRALEYTLDKFHNDHYPNAPYFLFGDFNFRTDTAGVIKKLTEDTLESKLPNKGNISKLQFRNKEDNLILTLGKKEFSHYEHQNVFIKNSGQWLREFDRELEDFNGRLLEFPIKFVPSYPFEEDIEEGSNYMQTRVPAWCDRVLLSPTAKALVQNASNAVEYGIIGPMTCMGDHKPVYLRAVLYSDAGTINCCNLPNAYQFCFKVPANYVDSLPDYPIDNTVQTISIDRSSNLLHAVPIKHDPYTPDSMDSPSPNAIGTSGEVPDVDLDNLYGSAEATSILQDEPTPYISKRIDRAVSPALLKSKLELIVRSKKQDSFDSEFESVDIKRSPSERHLYSGSDADRHKGVRQNRSNSDVSWQRSHLLTQAWIEGKGQQGYHSFSNFIHQSSSNSSPVERSEDLPPDLIIPRIAIINASNFESCDSSVQLQDDRLNAHSENRLNSFSESRTRTMSGEESSLERSDEICNKVDEESEKLSLNAEETIEMVQAALLRNTNKCILNKEIYSMKIESIKPIKDVMCKDEKINLERSDNKLLDNMYKEQNLSRDIENQNASKDMERGDRKLDKFLLRDIRLKEKFEMGEQAIEQFQVMPRETKGNHLKPYVIESKDANKQYVEASVKPKTIELQEYDSNVINESSNTYVCNSTVNEIEMLRSDSRLEMLASKKTTRSNSIQSQDTNDNGGNVKLKLKACNVTERYKNDIVSRKGKCQKCCCVVS